MYYNREESRTFAPPIARTKTFAASDGYSCARLVLLTYSVANISQICRICNSL